MILITVSLIIVSLTSIPHTNVDAQICFSRISVNCLPVTVGNREQVALECRDFVSHILSVKLHLNGHVRLSFVSARGIRLWVDEALCSIEI